MNSSVVYSFDAVSEHYPVPIRSSVSAPLLDLIMLQHRLGSWPVRRLFFLRLLPEVSCVHMKGNFVWIYVRIVGVKVVEVAHDIQTQVSKYIRDTLGLVNSYDTWHGTIYICAVYFLR